MSLKCYRGNESGPYLAKRKASKMGIYEAAISRRSIRRFKDIPISGEILQRCVNAARLAPSAANLQPLEYIIVDDNQLLPQVFSTLKWAAYISPEGDPPQGKRPKAYIVILKSRHIGVPSSVYDVGAAMENVILVALEEGIGSCPIASVDRDKLRKILNILGDYEIPLVLALGYPDESPDEESFDGSVKYWKDKNGVLHVPKKKLETVLHWNTF
jgi:nitroreductase